MIHRAAFYACCLVVAGGWVCAVALDGRLREHGAHDFGHWLPALASCLLLLVAVHLRAMAATGRGVVWRLLSLPIAMGAACAAMSAPRVLLEGWPVDAFGEVLSWGLLPLALADLIARLYRMARRGPSAHLRTVSGVSLALVVVVALGIYLGPPPADFRQVTAFGLYAAAIAAGGIFLTRTEKAS